MTILAPSVAARHVETPTSTTRQYIRYLFYKARPTWGLAPHAERAATRAELLAALEPFAERLPVLRAYSTLGTRGDADFLLWMVSERLEDFQELQAAVLRSPMGAHLGTPYSYLAMTKRSQYVDRHAHADQEGQRTRVKKPTGRRYLSICLSDGQEASVVPPVPRGAPARHGRAHPYRPRVSQSQDQHQLFIWVG